MLLNYRKIFILFFVTFFSFFTFANAKAQDTEYLRQIMINTNVIKDTDRAIQQATNNIKDTTTTILQRLDLLPKVLKDLGEFIDAWMDEDDSDTTTNMYPNFQELGEQLTKDIEGQTTAQTAQLNKDLLGNITKESLPYANDLVYSTLLGKYYLTSGNPPADPRGSGVNPQLNYIKNAAGMTVPHVIPNGGWAGSNEERAKYAAYYNTAMAAESFNAYVLSNQYVDGDRYNQIQTKLINQAKDTEKWFSEVASENIGFVLRQLLIYQSQIFVLMTQLIQTQKQIATAQVMTNALLISTSQQSESYLLSKAQAIRST